MLSTRFSSAVARVRGVHTEARLAKLGLILPELPQPVGAYTLGVQEGGWVYCAGHLPFKADMKTVEVGRLGFDLTSEQGAEMARTTA